MTIHHFGVSFTQKGGSNALKKRYGSRGNIGGSSSSVGRSHLNIISTIGGGSAFLGSSQALPGTAIYNNSTRNRYVSESIQIVYNTAHICLQNVHNGKQFFLKYGNCRPGFCPTFFNRNFSMDLYMSIQPPQLPPSGLQEISQNTSL